MNYSTRVTNISVGARRQYLFPAQLMSSESRVAILKAPNMLKKTNTRPYLKSEKTNAFESTEHA